VVADGEQVYAAVVHRLVDQIEGQCVVDVVAHVGFDDQPDRFRRRRCGPGAAARAREQQGGRCGEQ